VAMNDVWGASTAGLYEAGKKTRDFYAPWIAPVEDFAKQGLTSFQTALMGGPQQSTGEQKNAFKQTYVNSLGNTDAEKAILSKANLDVMGGNMAAENELAAYRKQATDNPVLGMERAGGISEEGLQKSLPGAFAPIKPQGSAIYGAPKSFLSALKAS
jgi:hypothetical protein